ncbi:flagellar filament capping protein FliD [Lysobacter olei]
MAISSAGIGSGLDVNSLVSQLVAAERAPGDARINRAETTTKAQVSAFGTIKAALSGLESALKKLEGDGSLPGRKATVGADAGFTASASASAALGRYAISVERLATAHKLQSAAKAADTQVGYGTLTLQVGSGDAFNVTIDQGKGTLSDIRDAINTQAAGKGVTATLVNGDAGQVLVLTSGTAGSAGALTVTTSGGDGGLSALATSGGTMTTVTPAQDAQVIVDGITRTATSNHLTDLIDGVTLDLTKAKPGETFDLEINSDPSTLKAAMLGFVSAYNTALSAMRTQSASGGEGKAAGPLSGDAAPRAIMQSLRGAISAYYGELSAMGLKTGVDGSLSLDGSKFDAAMLADPESVKRLVGSESGLGGRLRDSLASYVGVDGMLQSRSEALDKRLKGLSKQREDLDQRIEGIAAMYRRQFTALDAMMSQMQNTSSYLAQQISQFQKSS